MGFEVLDGNYPQMLKLKLGRNSRFETSIVPGNFQHIKLELWTRKDVDDTVKELLDLVVELKKQKRIG